MSSQFFIPLGLHNKLTIIVKFLSVSNFEGAQVPAGVKVRAVSNLDGYGSCKELSNFYICGSCSWNLPAVGAALKI